MMASNLRSVVARVFQGRFRQAAPRNFSSSPQVSRNGESVVVTGLDSSGSSLVRRDDPSLSSWLMAGYSFYFAWDMVEGKKYKRKLDRGREEQELQARRLNELISKHRLSRESMAKLRRVLNE